MSKRCAFCTYSNDRNYNLERHVQQQHPDMIAAERINHDDRKDADTAT